MIDQREYRVLICTENHEDDAWIEGALKAAAIPSERCATWTDSEEASAGVGVVILKNREIPTGFGPDDFDRAVPLIILQDHSETELIGEAGKRPHTTILPWPLQEETLVRAVRCSLQTRGLQSELAELKEQFLILTNRAPVAFGIVQGTRVVFANHFFAEWSGYTVDELLSLDFPTLVHPHFREMMLDRAKRRQAGEAVPEHYEFLALTKNGEERWFDFSPALIEYHGKPAVIGAGLDITTRKRAEQALQRSEASLRLLSQTARKLMVATHSDEALGGIFEDVAVHLGAEVFVNYLVTPDRGRLHLHSWRGLDEATVKSLEFAQFGQPLCGLVARERTRIVLPRVQETTGPETEVLRSLGIRAYACHPLQDHEVVGTISFCSKSRDEFSEEDLEVMRAVADQASMAMARQRLTVALEQRAAALDEANQAKDQFLAVLSHELRTPLTPVLAVISMLRRKGNLDPVLQRDMEMIRRNIELEAHLIDDLLDLNRIERGKVVLQKNQIDLCTVLQQAVEVCRSELEARQLHFTTHFGDVAQPVNADAARLQQVFWNLIKNAIKFTSPNGCIGIRCCLEDDHLVVRVADSGVGIDPEQLPKIFDAFAQADRNTTREFGGLGLGLSISKSLVELHGGTIEAHSEGKNKGSTFIVRLPLHKGLPPQADGSPRGGEHAQAVSQGLRILIAEDHRDTAEMISLFLQGEGHAVKQAGDVASALKMAGDEPFDLLVSDLGLPDASGLDLMRELRNRGITLPGIALSGYGQEGDIEKSREAGFLAHLVKPVDMDRLIEAIDDAIQAPLPTSL